MANKKQKELDKKEAPIFEIILTKEAKERPRKYQLGRGGEWVGVGGSIKIKPRLPYKPFTMREATAEEYKNIIFFGGKNKHLGYVKFI